MKSVLNLGKVLDKQEQKLISGGGAFTCNCPCAPDPYHCNVPLGPYHDCWSCLQ